MSKIFVLLIAVSSVTLPITSTAQPVKGKTTGDISIQSSIIHATSPMNIYDEWRLIQKNGHTVITDKSGISILGDTLIVHGNLRTLKFPSSSISQIWIPQSEHEFRNCFIGTFFLSAMVFLSPQNTSGYYLGSQKELQIIYNPNGAYITGESYMTPGISIYSGLLTVGSAVVGGIISHVLRSDDDVIMLNGEETETAWKELLSEQRSSWRLHGTASFVYSSSVTDWKKNHERYSIIDQSAAQSDAAYSRPTVSNINVGRLLRLGYAIDRSWEIGLGYQADGIQRFYQNFIYARPGTPPTLFIREISQLSTINTLLATVQYSLIDLEPLRTRINAGVGVGPSFVTAKAYGDNPQFVSRTLYDRTHLGITIFYTAEYFIDRTLSCGVTIDYSNAGIMAIPTRTFTDYDNRALLILDSYDLSLASIGIGFGFTLNL